MRLTLNIKNADSPVMFGEQQNISQIPVSEIKAPVIELKNAKAEANTEVTISLVSPYSFAYKTGVKFNGV